MTRPPPKSSPRDSDFGYTNTQAAQEVIEKLGIGEYMDEWTLKMRMVGGNAWLLIP